jgi:hypothetical protein
VTDSFKLQIPAGAKKMNPGDLPDFDELPRIFAEKKGNDHAEALRIFLSGRAVLGLWLSGLASVDPVPPRTGSCLRHRRWWDGR